MIKKLRNAFTIIELVIVIAVIAVLAAVLIPTFSSLVDKANNNVDTQLIRNLNIALKADVTNGEKHKTMHSALLCAKDAGYDIQKINAQGTDNEILWDSVNDVFCYYDSKDDKVKYVPESNIEEGSVNDVDYFKIYQEMPETSEYSIYLNNDSTIAEITVTVGFDAGNNNNITIIKYNGVDEVIIRTLGSCKFIVNETETVHHYGAAASESGEHDCHADVIDDSEYTEEDLRNLQFAGGKGTKESPYLVANSEQFEAFLELDQNKYRYIKLINDVEFVGTSRKEKFKGILDGNGHTIYYNIIDNTPYLFETGQSSGGKDYGGTIIKDLDWVSKDGNISSLVSSISSGYRFTFDNVTVRSEANLSTMSNYGYSAFCSTIIGRTRVYFKNCVNDINYSIPTSSSGTSYGGIFIGNYASNSFVSFENCINNGTVTGQYVGFFMGNTTVDIKIKATQNNITSNNNSNNIYVYNCKNEGIMVGTECVSAFGCNDSTYLKSHKEASENLINNGCFVAGTMFTSNINPELVQTENDLMIKENDDSTISYYEVGCTANITYTNGSGAFTYRERVQKSDIRNYKFGIINRIIARKDYTGTYDQTKEYQSGLFKYIIVENGDGTRDIIVDTTGTCSGSLYYSIAAYDSNDIMIGYNNYNLDDIE